MGRATRTVCSVLSAGVLLVPSAVGAGGQTPRHECLSRCTIVFAGRVLTVGDVSFAAVPRSPWTVVVSVDEVLEKPAAVSLVTGDRVTVEVKVPGQFHDGTRATFYTSGWIFGSGVAVREVGHEIAPQSSAG